MERAQSLRSRQLAAIAAVLAALLLACMQSGRAEPTISTPGPLGKPVPMHELEAVVAAQIADANVSRAGVVIAEARGVRVPVAVGQGRLGVEDAGPVADLDADLEPGQSSTPYQSSKLCSVSRS